LSSKHDNPALFVRERFGLAPALELRTAGARATAGVRSADAATNRTATGLG
jgi:hypothetical protein